MKIVKALLGVGLAVAGGSFVGLSPALASCKNLVCVQGSDDGLKRTHSVYLSSQMSGATHYNVIPPGGQQFELHINHFSFDIRPGRTYTFSVQVCKRGGFAQSSTCAQWAQFNHTVSN